MLLPSDRILTVRRQTSNRRTVLPCNATALGISYLTTTCREGKSKMKKKWIILLIPIFYLLLCSFEAAEAEALIKGCQQISNQLDEATGWKQKLKEKIIGPPPDIKITQAVDDNKKSFSNRSKQPVFIIHDGIEHFLFSGTSKTYKNEDPNRNWVDFQSSFRCKYDDDLVTMERNDWNVIFRDKKKSNKKNNDNEIIENFEINNNISDGESLSEQRELNNTNPSDYGQSNQNFEQSNTNMRQSVSAGSIPINFKQNSSLGNEKIVAYIMSKKPLMSKLDVERIINTYIQEAEKKGVNYEIAIAQMCYASKFLKNRKLIINYDYANINNGKSFQNMSEGIHSHIQHLYNLVSNNEDSLITWAEKNILYVRKIIIILYEMNAYAE
jgi:hypothetical protein